MTSETMTVEPSCSVCHAAVERDLVSVYPQSTVCLECMAPSELSRLEKELNQVQSLDRTRLAGVSGVSGWDVGLHYRPSRLLSGDFYDVCPSSEASGLRLLFGDVMGKGIPAALLRTGLEGALKALTGEPLSPADVLERVNRQFFSDAAPGRLASVFYGTVDGPEGELRYANAGHLPPLVRRADGSWTCLEATGMVLGALGDVPYTTERVSLSPGDLLALFSDGFTEAENAAGEPFDEGVMMGRIDALSDASPQVIASTLAEQLEQFAPGEPSDDRTLLIVRRT